MTKKYKQEDLKILAGARWNLKQLLHMVLWIVFFFLLIFFFGFLVSIPLYTVGFLKVQGKLSWLRALISGVILEAVVFLLFEVAMEFSLYRGWLFGEVIPPF